jgi:hypothetical protein
MISKNKTGLMPRFIYYDSLVFLASILLCPMGEAFMPTLSSPVY